jgi:phosphohistidine phosphatase SixA
MPGRLRRVLLAVLAPVIALTALPQGGRADGPAVPEALQRPGVHAIMRHALAPGFGDPAAFRLDDCATQRNLDDRGRQQARAIGRAFRAAGVAFDRVVTSQWCRCRETAALLDLGEPADFAALNSFFQDRTRRGAQTEELRQYIGELPAQEKVLFVTHQVNIRALTGRGAASGEVLLIRIDGTGHVEVLGAFLSSP